MSVRKNSPRQIKRRSMIESLEDRKLLSASPLDSLQAEPLLSMSPDATTSKVLWMSPSQTKTAYGFDQINFNGVTGDGAGQTIAIVGTYDDPTIAHDLSVFDSQFDLSSPASFKKVSQTGSTTSLPDADSDWSLELSLDVEWAHAIAPKANILLVEADSSNLGDLLSAVDYARHASGVSVVSMSWGSSEFWQQTDFDSYFTTPAGHQGVTFVAASGDDGSWYGPSWPSTSPGVLSVGGTSLTREKYAGNYGSELGWQGSGGGFSDYEAEPNYQAGVQTTGVRTSPDVSYNADPNIGFAVYDSTGITTGNGWYSVGGTSAGAPQWAALIAIANQGRSLSGKSSLNGLTQTLPAIYSLASNSATYTANFHDITNGYSSYWISAFSGYDLVTGLGSPKANSIVQALKNVSSGSVVTSAEISRSATTATARAAAMTRQIPASVVNEPLLEILRAANERVTVDAAPVARHNAVEKSSVTSTDIVAKDDSSETLLTSTPEKSSAEILTAIFSDHRVVRAAAVLPAMQITPPQSVPVLAEAAKPAESESAETEVAATASLLELPIDAERQDNRLLTAVLASVTFVGGWISRRTHRFAVAKEKAASALVDLWNRG